MYHLRLPACLFVLVAMLSACQSTAPGDATAPSLATLSDGPDTVQPLDVGHAAPRMTLHDHTGQQIDLAQRYRDQSTVLVFYRGGWCPFCTAHMRELASIEQDLVDMGFQIIAISPDRPKKLRASLGDFDPSYTLLSDNDVMLARAFGLAFRVDDETHARLEGFGIDLADASGRTHRALPVPAVYLIDQEGRVRFAHWDADYRRRLSGDAVLDAARAMQRR